MKLHSPELWQLKGERQRKNCSEVFVRIPRRLGGSFVYDECAPYAYDACAWHQGEDLAPQVDLAGNVNDIYRAFSDDLQELVKSHVRYVADKDTFEKLVARLGGAHVIEDAWLVEFDKSFRRAWLKMLKYPDKYNDSTLVVGSLGRLKDGEMFWELG